MVNYCGNYEGKNFRSSKTQTSKSKRDCGEWCQNKKTKRYERDKYKKNRTFTQKHDGKFCRPRNDKRDRDADGRIIRYYNI